MKVKIKYFAAMREEAGHSEESIDTSSVTAEELLTEVMNKYNFKLQRDHLKVAVNEEYVDFSTTLKENDTIVFIPPVAGG